MVQVRAITAEEIGAYMAAKATGFHHVLRPGEAEYHAAQIEPARTYGAFDDERIVGTARSFPTELTVPGGGRPTVAAVTNVTVTATHRRRGLLTEMMRRQLADITEPLAILIASEAPIYGRFGYGPATAHVALRIDTRTAGFTAPSPGGVELRTPEDVRHVGPAVYDRMRRAQVGAIERPDWWWDRRFVAPSPADDPSPGERFVVVRRGPDGPDGYASYRIRGGWARRVPQGVLEVDDLIAATPEAYAALWHHCLHVDLVTSVTAANRSSVEVLPELLVDRRAVQEEERADFLWVRLLDIEAALAARRYRVADRVVLEVVGEGRFVLEGGPDGATCTRTDAAADLVIAVADLGACYLGDSRLWTAEAAGRAVALKAGAVSAFDRMFGTDAPPWCNTWF